MPYRDFNRKQMEEKLEEIRASLQKAVERAEELENQLNINKIKHKASDFADKHQFEHLRPKFWIKFASTIILLLIFAPIIFAVFVGIFEFFGVAFLFVAAYFFGILTID